MSDRTELLQAAKEATRLTRDLGFKDRILKDRYTRVDPFAAAEAVELTVLLRKLPKLLGAFLREDDVPGILVNSDRPIGMVRMTCAHELGHFILGHDPHLDEDIVYADKGAITEHAANAFAYQLLVPRWLVANVMERKHWGLSSLADPVVIYQLSLRLGVSYTATVWSLGALKIIPLGLAKQLAALEPNRIKKLLIPEGAGLQADKDIWLLDQWDGDSILEPRAEDSFVLQLPSHAGAGFMWSLEEASQAGFTIKPVLLDPKTTPKPAAPVVVGSPAIISYIAEPTGAALNSNVPLAWTVVERQPWAPVAEPAGQVEMRTLFDGLIDGLTPGARRRYLKEMVAE